MITITVSAWVAVWYATVSGIWLGISASLFFVWWYQRRHYRQLMYAIAAFCLFVIAGVPAWMHGGNPENLWIVLMLQRTAYAPLTVMALLLLEMETSRYSGRCSLIERIVARWLNRNGNGAAFDCNSA